MNGNRIGAAQAAPQVPVRNYRLADGEVCEVTFLEETYHGMLTHWLASAHKGRKGESKHCTGDDCPPAIHSRPTIWKGYAAAEVWDRKAKRWLPVCFEVTESLELDLRDNFGRGQTWQVAKMQEAKTKNSKVTGILIETLEHHAIRPAFDVKPVLYHLYHVPFLCLDVPSPLPPRLVLESFDRAAPANVIKFANAKAQAEKPISPEEAAANRARLAELARATGGRIGNGKAGAH